MFIEIQTVGKKKKYYLAYSYKKERKVHKVRRYLGADLSEQELRTLRQRAEATFKEHVALLRRLGDPFKDVLSKEEVRVLNALAATGESRVWHLSERDWLRFTELFTYHTNAIEGSTVTLEEVHDILKKNRWAEGISKEEISETYGVAESVRFVRKTKEHISLKLIKELHEIIFKNSKSYAGQFRTVEVVIRDSIGAVVHQGAPAVMVPELLARLVRWYANNKKEYHPIVLAAIVHNQFEEIHPFQDGNGRIGRVLLNNILIKHAFPPVNIDLERRRQYYQTLQEYGKNGNLRPTIELILQEYRGLQKKLR